MVRVADDAYVGIDRIDEGTVSWRTGSNMDAILDLLENHAVVTVGKVLPHLVSEFGALWNDVAMNNGHSKRVVYFARHDWQLMCSVMAMTLQMMQRTDRILKAVPFIVNRAAWWQYAFVENGRYAYPFSLFRYNVTGEEEWNPTYLRLYYDFWSGVEGELIVSTSSAANVLTQAFCSVERESIFVVVHSLADTAVGAAVEWPAELSSVVFASSNITRLQWVGDDATDGVPSLRRERLGDGLPRSISLEARETVLLHFAGPSVRDVCASTAGGIEDERTYYSNATITPLPSGEAAAFAFELDGSQELAETMRRSTLRVGLSGTVAAYDAAIGAAAGTLEVLVNGARVPIELDGMMAGGGGKLHVSQSDERFFGAFSVSFSPDVLSSGGGRATVVLNNTMAAWSGNDFTVSSAMLVVAWHSELPPSPPPPSPTPPLPPHAPPAAPPVPPPSPPPPVPEYVASCCDATNDWRATYWRSSAETYCTDAAFHANCVTDPGSTVRV